MDVAERAIAERSILRKAISTLKAIATRKGYRSYLLEKALTKLGYDHQHWVRIEQRRAWLTFLAEIEPTEALEISPGDSSTWATGHRSYSSVQFPDFDICTMQTDRQFGVIIADNVFEHLPLPEAAAKNVHAMLKPGGWFLIATPFLIRVHGSPNDYRRWTEEGLVMFLKEAGFSAIQVDSWGNRACARAYIRKSGWPAYGWGRKMTNEREFPLTVWAFAQK